MLGDSFRVVFSGFFSEFLVFDLDVEEELVDCVFDGFLPLLELRGSFC